MVWCVVHGVVWCVVHGVVCVVGMCVSEGGRQLHRQSDRGKGVWCVVYGVWCVVYGVVCVVCSVWCGVCCVDVC